VCAWWHRTANQLEVELVDLVERLAAATGRAVAWKGGNLFAGKRLSAKQRMQGRTRTSDRSGSSARMSTGKLRVSDRTKINARSSRSSTGSERLVSSAIGGTYLIHEPDAEPHAVRLQEGMARTCSEPCHLEVPSSPDETEKCLERVAQCASVLLLQTRSVLTQPWALLAVYRAALANVSVVCVVVDEGGYDFGGAKLHLEHLSERLDAPALEQISHELSQWDPPTDVEALQSKLASLVPQIISVAYNPKGTDHALMATIRDVEDKQRLLQVRKRNFSAEDIATKSVYAACQSKKRASLGAAAAMLAPPPNPAPPPRPTPAKWSSPWCRRNHQCRHRLTPLRTAPIGFPGRRSPVRDDDPRKCATRCACSTPAAAANNHPRAAPRGM
jgi:hypothetical protein